MEWADLVVLTGNCDYPVGLDEYFAKSFPIVAIQEIKEMIPMPRKRAGGHH